MTKIAMLMLAAPIAAFAVETAFWNPNGSGLWSEGTRWNENEAPTINAYIKNVDAYATDGDFDFMRGLTRIRLQGTEASLDLRFDSDHEGYFNTLQLDWRDSPTKATVYKSGAGTFFHQTAGNGCYFSNYFVTNGVLKLGFVDSVCTNMVYGAFSPGQLLFSKSGDYVNVKGFVGDGAISSSQSQQFCLWGDCFHNWADTSPFVYSGALGANMNLTVMAGRHHFTGSTSERLTIRLRGGEIGARIFGKVGDSGSLGSSVQFNFLGESATLLYLGTGEETDKIPFFGTSCEQATIDAGANGGVCFSSVWDGNAAQDRTIVLTGSNTTECVIENDIYAAADRRTTIVKRGSGTWDLSDFARAKVTGPVLVEEGVLEVASLAPTNQACSMGLATNLGSSAAIVLGSPGKTGTLAYTGTGYNRAVGRDIALAGTGRLLSSSSTGVVDYFGVTAGDAEGATLVLDGTGTHDGVDDIGGGVGAVSLEKTGVGTWSVGGAISVAKTDVRQGKLVVNNIATRYNYYRFVITELWGGKRMQIREFGLFDANGNQVNAGLDQKASDGNPYDLQSGEIQFGYPFTLTAESNALYKLVDGNYDSFLDGSRSSIPTNNNPSTWYVFTMKLPDDAQPVCFYSIKASGGYDPDKTGANWNANHMCNFEARGWRVEASTDGRQWDLLDENYYEDATVAPIHGSARWYHSDSAAFNASNPGWSIPASPAARAVSLGAVSVAGGAELVADAPMEVSHLVIDATSGGSISNMTFAANGVLDIVNATKDTYVLPVQFAEGTDLSPVGGWTLKVNGDTQASWAIGIAGGRLRLVRPGFCILFR